MAINKNFIIPDAGLEVAGAATVDGALTVANTLAVGNTTVTGNLNVSVSANVGSTLRAGGLITGAAGAAITGTANATVAINVGANVNLSTTTLNVGNSTSNTVVSQTSVNTGNSSLYSTIGQATGLFGNSTVNTYITSTSIRTGNSSVYTNVTPTALTTNGTLSVTGTATFSNNVTISGDLTVSGTTTYVNTATLNVADNIVTLNSDVTGAPSENAGIEINRGTSANVSFIWNETADKWQITTNGTTFGNVHSTLTDVVLGTDTSGNYVATVSSANGVGGSGTGEGSAPSLYAIGANGITVTTAGINVQAGTELTSNTSGIHHNDITRTNTTTGNTSPNYSGTFTAVDSITTNARGHVTAVNTKTVTMPASNNTTYTTLTVANTVANQGISRLTSSSNANTDTYAIGLDEITVSSNSSGVYIDHNDITRSDTTNGNTSPNYTGTFTTVDSITTNARGHVTAINTKTVTMPSSNNTTYDLAAVANSAANEGMFNLTGSDTTTDTVKVIGLDEITVSSNTTAVYIDHNDITRTNTTNGNTSPNYAGTFTAVDSITTNARGHVTAVNTKTVTMPSSNNTTYTTATVANSAANQGVTRLTSSANANTDTLVVGLDEITISSNSTAVYVDHNDVARTNTTDGNTAPNYAGTFTTVDSITTNARGHVTAVNTKTVTMPSSNNTTYDLAAAANTVANEGIINLTGSNSTTDTARVIGLDEITISSNSTAVYVDHNDVTRTNTTDGNTAPNYAGTFTAVDSITTNARGHVTAVNVKTITMPASNNTTYDLTSVSNTVSNQGRVRLTSSGNANDDVILVGSGTTTVSSNSTQVTINTNDQYVGTVTSVSGTGSINGLTLSGTVTTTGNLTLGGSITAANTSTAGIVQLSDSTNDTSVTVAATANSVKTAYDLAASKGTGSVTSVTGGNGLTGSVTISGSLNVGAGTGITVNADDIAVNADYIATISSNSALYANNSSTNTFTVGTSSYFVSNGNVGFGTTAPVGKVDINGRWVSNITTVSASAVDCAVGNYFIKTATGALTWTFTNVPANRAYNFILELTNGGTGSQTWPTSVKWPSGTAPTLTSSGVDVIGFITDDGGTTWRGVMLMKDSK